MARIRQSRPDSGLDFQIQVFQTFQIVASSLEMMGEFGEHLGGIVGRLVSESQLPQKTVNVLL